ncbi:Exocyst complex component 7, partial [Ilyodon furcidens]
FMNVYFQIRSSQLDRSIKGLKEHFRKNSASSGILYSPAVQTKRKDTPTKKAPKRPGTIRKAQNLLKQYSQHGLDGKKGGSNLTPLEGKAPRSCLCSLFSTRSGFNHTEKPACHNSSESQKSPKIKHNF